MLWEPPGNDVRSKCIIALAQQSGNPPEVVLAKGVKKTMSGTVVDLLLNGSAPWKCYVDKAGKVTKVEFQGEG